MKNKRLIFTYAVLIFTAITYVVASSYTYQLRLKETTLENQINVYKDTNDELSLEINIKNSRDSVLKDYPNLQFNNNISHLSKESE